LLWEPVPDIATKIYPAKTIHSIGPNNHRFRLPVLTAQTATGLIASPDIVPPISIDGITPGSVKKTNGLMSAREAATPKINAKVTPNPQLSAAATRIRFHHVTACPPSVAIVRSTGQLTFSRLRRHHSIPFPIPQYTQKFTAAITAHMQKNPFVQGSASMKKTNRIEPGHKRIEAITSRKAAGVST
jgi:hypothetical protein